MIIYPVASALAQ